MFQHKSRHLLSQMYWTHITDVSSSVQKTAQSKILTQEFFVSICGGEVQRCPFSVRAWPQLKVWVIRCQCFSPNPCASSILSASTSMDTTWWPGIMAKPRTLGSPWENVSKNTQILLNTLTLHKLVDNPLSNISVLCNQVRVYSLHPPVDLRNSWADPRMTLQSRSVQRKSPTRVRPSVMRILMFLFRRPCSFCLAWVDEGISDCSCNARER